MSSSDINGNNSSDSHMVLVVVVVVVVAAEVFVSESSSLPHILSAYLFLQQLLKEHFRRGSHC